MGGVSPDHDATYWDERYAASGGDKHQHRLSGGPDPTLVEVAAGLRPGRALDVAAGRGRHALWLAAHGWQVTAVDFSRVAIDDARDAEAHAHAHEASTIEVQAHEARSNEARSNEATSRQIGHEVASMSDEPVVGPSHHGASHPVEWIVADATTWEPAPDAPPYDLVLCAFFHLADDVFPRLRSRLAPGGHLVVLGHALRNLTDGVGGPTDPRYLHTEDGLRSAAAGLSIERLTEVIRPTDHGDQIDLVLVARNP